MAFARFEVDERPGEEFVFRVLSSMMGRLRGLLLTEEDAFPVALLRCSSVHTIGMSYAIDIAFVGAKGEVLRAERAVPPGRVLGVTDAYCTFERPASGDRWLVQGEHMRTVAFVGGTEDAYGAEVLHGCNDELWNVWDEPRRAAAGRQEMPAMRGGALRRHEDLLRLPLRLRAGAVSTSRGTRRDTSSVV